METGIDQVDDEQIEIPGNDGDKNNVRPGGPSLQVENGTEIIVSLEGHGTIGGTLEEINSKTTNVDYLAVFYQTASNPGQWIPHYSPSPANTDNPQWLPVDMLITLGIHNVTDVKIVAIQTNSNGQMQIEVDIFACLNEGGTYHLLYFMCIMFTP